MRKMTIFNFTWKNSTMRYRPGSTSAEVIEVLIEFILIYLLN